MARKVAANGPTQPPTQTQRIVIADASPIIGLSLIGGLDWLRALFGTVWITRQVCDELLAGYPLAPRVGMREIDEAIQTGTLKLLTRDWPSPLFPHLDEGEASVLRAAMNQTQPCLVVIDEALGRRAARDAKIAVTGLVGVIIAAKKAQLIPAAAPIFAQLDEVGFRLARELIDEALRIVGEASSAPT